MKFKHISLILPKQVNMVTCGVTIWDDNPNHLVPFENTRRLVGIMPLASL
jgi:hypothetical protein